MQTNQIEAVAEAARILGNQAKMARALDVTPVTVGQWLKPPDQGGREVPPKQCVRIERLTNGGVTRRALRADDWQEFWPELAEPLANGNIAPSITAATANPQLDRALADAGRDGLIERRSAIPHRQADRDLLTRLAGGGR